jgi:hypothetical protein
MVQLPREYKPTALGKWLPLLVGGFFAAGGLVFLCIGLGAILLGADFASKQKFAGIGAVCLFGGIGFAIYLHRNQISHTIQCTPSGFSVATESKRLGARREEYRWDEVTGTNYEQTVSRSAGDTTIVGFFSADTIRGQAFKVDHNLGDFPELITVFNERTPHLPYLWKRDEGVLSGMIKMMSTQPEYDKVARHSGAVPPPLPPPAAKPPPLPP